MNIVIINKFRGIAFILMFIYHIFIFLKVLTKYNYLNNPFLNFIGIISRNIFIILVGISLYLSFVNSKNITEYKKKQLLRSIKIYSIAIYITILTYFIINNYYIVFGVLHFISLSIFILHPFINNIPILLFIFIICILLSNSNYTIPTNPNSFSNYINGIIGFNIYKTTIDSFPLIKWIPNIIIGIFIGYFIYYFHKQINKNNKNNKKNKNTKKIKQKINIIQKIINNEDLLSFIGKNTLLLYIIHIPIIYIIIKLFIHFFRTY